ncbi:hypothetical protein QU487_17870 [Crenobacter sp. SG2305]|uniref:hypothetical protein n=1 Tax=Crenobacter oryzisoli TaxID=3056844 RepID=UPI0025AAAA12|nr:hypothetical protein [Crenobacter sp. SG2305]MDN0084606.1 hypothetical protein [Crenobacter sp. SG2305]
MSTAVPSSQKEAPSGEAGRKGVRQITRRSHDEKPKNNSFSENDDQSFAKRCLTCVKSGRHYEKSHRLRWLFSGHTMIGFQWMISVEL